VFHSTILLDTRAYKTTATMAVRRARPQHQQQPQQPNFSSQQSVASAQSNQSLSLDSLMKSAPKHKSNLRQPRIPPRAPPARNYVDDDISYANTNTMVSTLGDPTTITTSTVASSPNYRSGWNSNNNNTGGIVQSSTFYPNFGGGSGGGSGSSGPKQQQQQQQHLFGGGDSVDGGNTLGTNGMNDDASNFEDELLEDSGLDFSTRDLTSTTSDGLPRNSISGAGIVLAQRETTQIGWLRGGVLTVLLVATALVSLAIFYNTRWVEIEFFEGQFQDHSHKVIDRFAVHLEQVLAAMEHLGELYTTTADSQAQTATAVHGGAAGEYPTLYHSSYWVARQFPLVTLPEFEIQGDSVRQRLSHGTQQLCFVPIVPNDATREMWETYSRQHSYWVQDGLRQQLMASSSTIGGTGDETDSANTTSSSSSSSSRAEGVARRKRRQLYYRQEQEQRHLEKTEIEVDKTGNVDSDTPEPTSAQILAPTGGDANDRTPAPSPNNNNDIDNPTTTNDSYKEPDQILKPTFPPYMETPTTPTTTGTPPYPAPTPMTPSTIDTTPTVQLPPPPRPTVSFPLPVEGEQVQLASNGVSGRVYYLAKTKDMVSGQMRMDRVVEPFGSAPYAPIWQSTPVLPGLVNYNLLSHPLVGPELRASLTSQEIVIGRLMPTTTGTEDDNDDVARETNTDSTNEADPLVYMLSHTKFTSTTLSKSEPRSLLFVPVLFQVQDDTASSSATSTIREGDNSANANANANGGKNVVVGIVTAVVAWSELFVGIVKYSAPGATIAVMENSCGQQYSYEIVGQEVSYMGVGDLHERKWDSLVVSIDFATLMESSSHSTTKTTTASTDTTTTNTGGDETEDSVLCPYVLRLYPTQKLYDSYRTWKPTFYTIGVILTFIFTAAVFGSYDILVERRQKLVLETAVKSSAVVSSRKLSCLSTFFSVSFLFWVD
jgi:hypothetical protein